MATDPRTVYLVANPLPNAAELRWPDKDPGDSVPLTLDASRWLPASDTIESAALESQPGDLTAAMTLNSGAAVTWKVSGGSVPTDGPVTDYQCTITLTTAGGYVATRSVWMRVSNLSINAGYPGISVSVIQGETGTGIGDITQPNGNATAVIALSDGTTRTIELPPGPSGVGNLTAIIAGSSTATLAAAITAMLGALPTAPGAAGTWWNNNGFISQVEP